MTVEGRSVDSAGDGGAADHFPVGMRVLAVDDDPICLKVLEHLLRKCQYHGLFLLSFRVFLFGLMTYVHEWYVLDLCFWGFWVVKCLKWWVCLFSVLPAVTTTKRSIEALKMLRENRNKVDLVISDVNMPDMDGFKLLELVGLEMDLPVISKLFFISLITTSYVSTSSCRVLFRISLFCLLLFFFYGCVLD